MMNDEQLKAVVLDLFQEVTGISVRQIVSSRHFAEYGMDSVSAVDLVVMLEHRFSIDIPNHVLSRLRCIDDVVKYLRVRLDAEDLDAIETPAA